MPRNDWLDPTICHPKNRSLD